VQERKREEFTTEQAEHTEREDREEEEVGRGRRFPALPSLLAVFFFTLIFVCMVWHKKTGPEGPAEC
jgi:hypothetical protein